jgi:prepilin-type N-terminal cleavage/methylation domain-containing protein
MYYIKRLLHTLTGRSMDAKGFTLIELMIVAAILAILAVVLVPNLKNRSSCATPPSALEPSSF